MTTLQRLSERRSIRSLEYLVAPILSAAFAVVGFGVIPAFGSDYWFNAILIPFLIMSLTGLGLNLLMGYAGQASLGAGGFMAVGAYVTYNVLLRLPALPLPVALLFGGLVAGVVGIVFGLPSLRIRAFYLLASTLAAQFFLEWLFNQYSWFSNYSPSGLISAPRLEFLGYDLREAKGRYLLTLTTVSLLTWLAYNLVNSQTGRNWKAIRDMDTAAAIIGIPVSRNKLLAFFVSSFVIGVGGALWAFAYLGSVDTRTFSLDRSFTVMFIVIIGGLGSISGSYIGAAFMVLLPILLDHIAAALFGGSVDGGQIQNLQHAFFGALIIFFLAKEPDGLVALIKSAAARLSSRKAAA